MEHCETQTFHFKDDGTIPNSELPLVVFRQCAPDDDSSLRQTLEANDWGGIWIDSIYDYHHYHSTAHEILCILQGNATIQMGGESGETLNLTAGDVMVIPAGVAHKLLYGGPALKVLGAYPKGQEWDMRTGDPDDRPQVIENIKHVPLPACDPLHGKNGALLHLWSPVPKS